MKKNRLLVLSLLACTLLVGCDEKTTVENGEKPVVDVTPSGDGSSVNMDLNLQKFYENLKSSAGGSTAVEKLLNKVAEKEYADLIDPNANPKDIPTDESFNVSYYHDKDSIKEDITEVFKDIVDGTSYLDDDGNFDPEAYKEYVEETLDIEVGPATEDGATSANYISDADVRKALKYNYDAYIEEEVRPDILVGYMYFDYVTGSSKYRGQFSNQYAVKLEVLKMNYDTSKLNGAWCESLVKDVKSITGNKEDYKFNDDYSFVTFNSNNEMIVFDSTDTELKYNVYTISDDNVKTYVPSYIVATGNAPIRQLDMSKEDDVAKVTSIKNDSTTKIVEDKSWTIKVGEPADSIFYKNIETLLIARDLWKIDHEVVLAKNYDYKTSYYEAMTETEKNEAQTFSNTYSSSNSKPIKEVAKQRKISAQQNQYYNEPDYYNRSTYTNVLPSALSSLRGTSARELMINLKSFGSSKYLLPPSDTLSDPVYLDTSSSTYYICEVSSWYGYYVSENILDSSVTTKQVSNYQIDAYQSGKVTEYKLEKDASGKSSYVEDNDRSFTYAENKAGFKDIIGLVKVSADNIITDAMRKEAIVSLFEKYSLEINDQDIYDYISNQYPDYFAED